MQEVIAALKSNPPNTFKCAGSGVYSIGHLPIEILNRELGVKILNVPTRGGGEGVALQMGGHTHLNASYPGALLIRVKSQQSRAYANFGHKRIKNFEDIPTFIELGYPNITFYSWYGWIAHKDTPAPIVEKLTKLVKDVTHDPAFISMMEKSGDIVDYADPETLKKDWQKEYKQLYPLIDELEKEKREKEKK